MYECHTQKKGFVGKCIDLIGQYWKVRKEVDAVLVTFPGHHLVPLVWLLTRFPRKKLIFDAFISLTDTLVSDRQRYSWFNPYSWLLFAGEFLSYHLADQLLIDTEAHKQFFARRFRLKPDRIRVIYVGTRNDLFRPRTEPRGVGRGIQVLFFGSYIPLQGIEYVVSAAAILQDTHPHIHFTLIGAGQTRKAMEKRASLLGLKNITFEDWIPYEEIPDRIHDADICLGIFGTSGKAQRVIPHKVFDAVACNVPVITARSPAILEKYSDGKEVIICEAGNPQDLAQTIRRVAEEM